MIPPYTPPAPTEREIAWMEQHRRKRQIKLLERQLAAAKRRRFSKTLVPLALLEELLGAAK